MPLEKKNCHVVGIDLSMRMLRFAEISNLYNDVKFVHADATDLFDFADGSLDFVISVLMHELTMEN